ncbi:cytochrome b [Paraburkholderia caballeronis]|uniref:Cytochrome b561 n=1 Tax=Paraburkholderia caballeronis TaxID=416943 RepID=A0A1H7PQH3_9BURK|nr:cytochrome b [Paraburkholderia caballeronis]PXW24275.1 cytochrome b561 [Paraburkholderia caballeronis]PXX00057.1 cytochrome b561 [Paraburkholderia caballeronis]RAJ97186.1 cytochrome b561 [Paraburkholderia caballeronis]TDV08325.1 cytochrome b561 [Paraburkholderia caballeronis]TDV12017.1 cytochrome b561 [Paraburkholderia caballeronis]
MNLAARAARRYTGIAMLLHWLIAALIVWGFALGWVMTDIPGITPTKLRYFSWHKWIGVTVLALVLVRIVWRATHAAPPLPASMHAWERLAAHAGHAALYLLMVAIPVTGYLYSSAAGIQVVYLGIWPLPVLIGPDNALKAVLRTVHVTLNYALLAMVAAHLLAVVKHQWLDRQRILARMLPFGTPRD